MRGWLVGFLLIANGCAPDVVRGPGQNEARPDPDRPGGGSGDAVGGALAGGGGAVAGSGGAGGTGTTGGGGTTAGPGGGGVGWVAVDGLIGCCGHTATQLEDGSVLVVGSCSTADSTPVGAGLIGATGAFEALRAPGARMAHTATRLGNGSVLLAGGFDAVSGASAATHWLYEPLGAGFAEAGALEQPRFGHAAALLPDGRVLLTGGNVGDTGVSWVGTGVTPSAELVSADGEGGLGFAASMLEARSGHATVPLAGDILAIGGYAWDHALADVERYDGAAWSLAPSLPQPVGYIEALPIAGNRIFVLGSEGGFVLEQDAWKSTAPAAFPTYLGAALAAFGDGSLLVVSSHIYGFNCIVARYAPPFDTWESVEPGPIVCGGSTVLATSLADGRVLVVSGDAAVIYELL